MYININTTTILYKEETETGSLFEMQSHIFYSEDKFYILHHGQ